MNDQERREQRAATYNNPQHRAELAQRIGARILQERTKAGITPEQIEQAIGIKARQIRNIEQGRYLPSTDTLEAIANAIGCRLEIVKN